MLYNDLCTLILFHSIIIFLTYLVTYFDHYQFPIPIPVQSNPFYSNTNANQARAVLGLENTSGPGTEA